MKRAMFLAGTLMCVMAALALWTNGSAQDNTSIGFDVLWPMDESGTAGAACTWDASVPAEEMHAVGVAPVGFAGAVTIADATGEIVYIDTLAGTFLDGRSCVLPVDAAVAPSLAYTIRVNGQHVATIPREGLAGMERPVVSVLD